MGKTKKTVAIIIPCLNEEKTIASVIKGFKKNIYKITHEVENPDVYYTIYPVDNGSTDSTWLEMKNMQLGTDYIIPLQCHQRGKGAVIRQMFNQINADVYVICDGDQTYNADDLSSLVKPILQKQADVMIGDRLSSTYFKENKRPFHNVGNKMVNWLINLTYKANVKDTMSGFRACNKEFAKSFAAISDNFEIETEMTMFMLENGFNYYNVTIGYKDRPSGSKSKLNTYVDGYKVIKTILSKYIREHSMKILGTIGLIVLIAGLIMQSIYMVAIGAVIMAVGAIIKTIVKETKEIKRLQINNIKAQL